jgi:hypothetical protein
MGDEVAVKSFGPADFTRFRAALTRETASLEQAWRAGAFDRAGFTTGFELEGWLIDHNYFPAPINEAFLARMTSALVVHELSKFNVELNGTPQALGDGALRRVEEELTATWRTCLQVAHDLEATLVLIGILPTIRNADLCLANISPLNRYRLLNEEILRARSGRAIELDIAGREHLRVSHEDVMLEAATTSFQVHLQVPADEFTRYFNASVLLSAPMVAVAANAPFLFGTDLWDETRIPLFEQAVDTGDERDPAWHRVTFGTGYLADAPLRTFRENLERFPALLPLGFDEPEAAWRHARLHNGTIWRWNRPLVGFNEQGVPHLRIEHRVMAAGPSILDMIANAALYLGAARFLAGLRVPPESDLPFEDARRNFYDAARAGLDARMRWLDGTEHAVRDVLLHEIVPMAREGLLLLGVSEDERDRYLDVIAARVRTGQNGAAWQRAHAARHGRDLHRLVAEYLENQRSAAPVHQWPI